jgi:enamine deaminase RidA (YjgF/YER057c/UK114 family)
MDPSPRQKAPGIRDFRKKGQTNMKILQPPNWPRPKGYANGIAAKGSMVFVSGMVGWDAEGKFAAKDFAGQMRQALANIVAVLNEAGAKPEHIARMSWYVVDKNEYLAAAQEIGAIYREIIGRHYPAMTVVEVSGLLEAQARLEIEVTAVVPE